MHVPSTGRGGLGSSSQAPTGSIGIAYKDKDEDDEEVDQRRKKLGPSQLQDALGTDALGHKGKGKTRRQ
jgi:hypothetical protein